MSFQVERRFGAGACLCVTLSAGLLLASAAVAQNEPWATVGGPVEPAHSELVPAPVLRSGLDEPVVADHPSIEDILPMEMPQAEDRRGPSSGPGDAVWFDAETGETWKVPGKTLMRTLPQRGGQSFRGLAGEMTEAAEAGGRGFGTKSLVSDVALQSFPRSPNVKLVMRFVNVDGNDVFRVCSGTMWDAGVVLTAGHCVHAAHREDTNGFAEEIWVYPAWDGLGSLRPGGFANRDFWGWARGTEFGALTGWTNDANFDWDVGMIRLNRSGSGNRQLGMLTGWFGWAHGGGCGWIQQQTYYNFSYPAEECPTAGLHTGRDMYHWSGTIDSCSSNGRQMRIETGDQCLTALWGGESGSSVYYNDDGNRYAHGVASTSNRSTRGNYVKLWEGFINYFTDTIRPNTRGTSADWELLRFRSGHTRLAQGGPTGASTVRVANATNADPAARNFILRVYLSTNNNVTASDTLLATYTYSNVDFSSMEMRTFNVPSVNIPGNTPPGTYWLGAVLETSGDQFPGNNNTWGWDAQQVTVRSSEILHDRFER